MGSNLGRLDATTDEEVARQIAEDPDTAPELTDEMLDGAEVYDGDKFVRRVGRPKGSGTKELVTLRLDRAILDHFRAGGPGWQTRINGALQAMLSAEGETKAMSMAFDSLRHALGQKFEGGQLKGSGNARPAAPGQRARKRRAVVREG